MDKPNLRDVKGRVFDIQRFSIHDGPGIRTTVFLKGCPLRCAWCHNPEGMRLERELSYIPARCIGCGYCFKVCPHEAHVTVDGRHELRRDRCVVCGACAHACCAKALEVVGRDVSVGETLDEVLRDKPFYETSGGGMTLSGGEPMMQIDFSEALLRGAHAAGLHCCMETCGYSAWELYERVLPFVDLFLYDIKESDSARHRELTGVPNEPIVENLLRLDERGRPMVLRCPIIPGINDRDDHFAAILALAGRLRHLRGVEIMPYHSLGDGKLGRFGHSGEGRVVASAPAPETVETWKRRMGKYLLA